MNTSRRKVGKPYLLAALTRIAVISIAITGVSSAWGEAIVDEITVTGYSHYP